MSRDQIINAFLIPLAWEPVNGDQKSAWPYAVVRPVAASLWVAFRYNVALADPVKGGVAYFPTEADAIAACEADHRAEAVKTWDIAKIEALVGRPFNSADWYWRVMDPDDCGETPEEAINRSMLGNFCVCEIASSFAGPTRFGFVAPVADPESDDEEFVHFATHEEAMDAAKTLAAIRGRT